MAGAVRLQAEAHAVAGRRLRAVVRAAAEAGAAADAAERLLRETRSAWGWAGKGGGERPPVRPDRGNHEVQSSGVSGYLF